MDDQSTFSYPIVDLGEKYGINGQVFSECKILETDDGETLSMLFETGSRLKFDNSGDRTRAHFEIAS
ncbi:hypothetical protein [Solemya velesiana gill symbiont]|uniref:Uncharacterized protein n=1 Tax=Solemya velesiana gill symbiont TaxID=1918948 RepID=A0A1T2KS19_9GAMM|nr:hypothetical protein [Solemya velesiana gill symbiont]OOZ35647.1 hypothetical protein BOW51_11075 [Solemya velesiana gill symbiont]